MKSGHTPGPWEIDSDGAYWWIRSTDGRLVLKNELPDFPVPVFIGKTATCYPDNRSKEEHAANARLISAAPDLLEASLEFERLIGELLRAARLEGNEKLAHHLECGLARVRHALAKTEAMS